MATHTAIATTSLGVFEEIQVPTAQPDAGQILLKVEYASMIAFDTYQTDLGYMVSEYPLILGFNGAGTVAQVGPDVLDLKVGDRIVAYTYQTSNQKGMQQYCVQPLSVCAKVPDSMSLEDAATIPDNFITAFGTLFAYLGLPHPESYPPAEAPADATKPILIYGAGSTSGQYALQILKVAGYKNVVATASPQHHEYLKSIGATAVLDYRSPTMAQEIINAAGGKIALVMDCISAEATIEAIGKVIDPTGSLAILLPVKKGDNVRADGDASAMTFDTSSEHIPKTVTTHGVRTFLYQDVEYQKENLMPKILPDLLRKGLVQPNRVKLLDQGTLKERVAIGLDLLRNNKVSGEKVVVKIN